MSETSLLQLADRSASESRAFRDDLRSMLFPASLRPPSDRQISEYRQCLAGWVSEIETRLGADAENKDLQVEEVRTPYPICWNVLAASGLLTDDALMTQASIQLLHSRVAGHREEIGAEERQLAAMGHLASTSDSETANAANRLIAAYLRRTGSLYPPIAELPAEIVNLLSWRVVAAHETMDPGAHDRLAPCVPALLAAHDESAALVFAADLLARKLFEGGQVDRQRPEMLPERQGLALSLALLALASGLSATTLAAMADDYGLARLALVMRALDYSSREAGQLLGWVAARTLKEQGALAALAAYDSLPRNVARDTLKDWKNVDQAAEQGR